ncbi:MAG TPA: DUF3011 domain-containing protein [Gemmatimonadaceae bacterium]|nr:DUF3011 domain-containing protein [Gemmatimonadaceae bacterium]
MRHTITFMVTFCAGAGAMVAAPRAQAQARRTITCESLDRRARECPIPRGSDVRIVEQLSATSCRENDTWGVGNGYVWVDRGCRARFAIDGRVGGGYGRGSGNGGYGGGGYGRGGYDHRSGGYDHRPGGYDQRHDSQGGTYGYPGRGQTGAHGPWRRGGQSRERGDVGRAEQACTERARRAGAVVTRFGDWSRSSGGQQRADMTVRFRGGEHRARCTYDPRRGGSASVSWGR